MVHCRYICHGHRHACHCSQAAEVGMGPYQLSCRSTLDQDLPQLSFCVFYLLCLCTASHILETSWLCLGGHDRQFHLPSHLSTSPPIDWDFMCMLTYSTLQLVILLLCALQLDCKKPSNVHAYLTQVLKC